MSPLFLIDIVDTIRLVFSMNDRIIIHYIMILLNYLMNGWIDRAILESDHFLASITSRFMLMVGLTRTFSGGPSPTEMKSKAKLNTRSCLEK